MKKKLAFLLCMTLTLCSTSGAVLAAESEQDADPASALISAADMPPSVSAYPAEVRTSEENGVYHLEKVYYLTAKDDPSTIPTADFEREGRTYTLLDMLKNDQTETDTREHIEVVTLDSKTKDMAEILKMLEPKLEVKTEDGYEGILSLDHTKYTAVTSDLYYSGGYLGTLNIPSIGLTVRVYQGTDSAALVKGAGHFTNTSIWDGNAAIAGHNRGVNNHFGKIHTLNVGDTIKLTTKLGERSYEVYSVAKIGADDTSVLNDSTENIITLVTCVMNQPDYRWCVQARQK